ncbi:MAG: PEGA domain-containing protein [Deltaproteobacteria bacterium]|nr:PEGA domain-containing protein [Deltaproteobacteria bacterium]
MHASNAFSDTDDTDDTEDDKAVAQAFFEQGESHYRAEEYEAAAEAFINAYETMPHYAVLANIGLAYQRAQNYPLAVEYLRKYLSALMEEGKENPKIADVLQQTLQQVSELVISVNGVRSDCDIYIDDVNHGIAPAQVIVLPGEHSVRLVQDGQDDIVETLSVGPGETKHYTFAEIETAAAPTKKAPPAIKEVIAPPPSQHTPEGQPRLQTAYQYALGGAIVGGITSVVLLGVAWNTQKKFDDAKATKDFDTMNELRPLGRGLVAGAIITSCLTGAALSTYLILRAKHTRSIDSMKTQRVSVMVSPEVLGLDVRF